MLGDLPEELKKYVPNYELNIIELRGDKEYIIKKSKEEGGEVQMCALFDEMVRKAEKSGEVTSKIKIIMEDFKRQM